MKILITGGAGYIGSMLIPRLLMEGHQVTVVDNFMYDQTSLLQYCGSPDFCVIRGDVTNYKFIIDIYAQGWDVVIPLACLTGAPLCGYNPDYAESVIVDAIRFMIECVHSKTKIIYPTTNSGYGVGTDAECTEKSPLNPLSGYGKWKMEAEQLILKRGNAISFRLATAFGVSPRMRLDLLVNDFTYRAVNDGVIPIFEGGFRRNFVHVRDICGAIVHAINNWERMKNEIYNVGLSSANMTKLQLAKAVAHVVGKTSVVEIEGGVDPDKRDYVVSNAKLEATGWKANVSLEEGIRELIRAYQIIKRNQHANI